jgi:hypothetical protein
MHPAHSRRNTILREEESANQHKNPRETGEAANSKRMKNERRFHRALILREQTTDTLPPKPEWSGS